MVETAVRLAQAAQALPERLKRETVSQPEVKGATQGDSENQILDREVVGETSIAALEGLRTRHAIPESSAPKNQEPSAPATVVPTPSQSARRDGAAIVGAASATEAPKKNLFWSAALNPTSDGEKAAEADQSHVPPVLRSLRKCEDCGFPVSPGRALCVDCEEKKWRGQLRVPKASGLASAAVPAATPAKPEAQAFAAAAQSTGLTAVQPQSGRAPAAVASSGVIGVASPAVPAAMPKKESREIAPQQADPVSALRETESPAVTAPSASLEFVLSAGIDPAQSWLARNKYVVGVLLAVGVAVAAIFLLR
jgi:hypothetical protein